MVHGSINRAKSGLYLVDLHHAFMVHGSIFWANLGLYKEDLPHILIHGMIHLLKLAQNYT